MKIIELRIGNIVGFKNRDDCYCVVTDLSSAGGIHLIRKFYDGDEDDQPEVIDDITPIPLTEEWLLKFGFKYQDRDVSHGNGHIERFYISSHFGEHWEFWLELQLNNNWLKTFFVWLMWNIGGGRDFVHLPYGHKLEYVHQLQNLYFALTGEELTILNTL